MITQDTALKMLKTLRRCVAAMGALVVERPEREGDDVVGMEVSGITFQAFDIIALAEQEMETDR